RSDLVCSATNRRAASVRARSRPTMTTRIPVRARPSAVWSPIPELAPVTIAIRGVAEEFLDIGDWLRLLVPRPTLREVEHVRGASMPIIDRIAQFHDDLTSWRRDIHAHPELGFEERRTSDLVAQKLAEFGCEVHRGIGQTGVVGRLRVGSSARSVGLRADMDALPIQEANSFDHRSRHDGRMHACGHDGHTTMLLGAARYLAETRDFEGTVHFIFQPAEEGLGGAEAMVKEGVFVRFPCDAIFGMHNAPQLAVGKFAIRTGPMMAGGAFFDITVVGRGAHGARPETGIDPVVTASHIAAAMQTIVSRNVRPVDTAVVSVTRFQAGDAYNVIPVRAFNDETLALIERNMGRIASGVAAGFGATAELDFRIVALPLVNDPSEAA